MARYARERTPQEAELAELYGQVYQAWENWKNAEDYFMFASDPELIDYAIYMVEATRRFYMYMLKKVQHLEAQLNMDSELPLNMLPASQNQPAQLLNASK